jgi:UDP-N-acetyl-2-amino-2-deoxyglucuronate dehydrogenase
LSLDLNDSVGIPVSLFPDAQLFVGFEERDRYTDQLRCRGEKIDFATMCSPNHLYDASLQLCDAHRRRRHPREAMPSVPGTSTVWRRSSMTPVAGSLLRLHPAIIALRDRFAKSSKRRKVELTYIASRSRTGPS